WVGRAVGAAVRGPQLAAQLVHRRVLALFRAGAAQVDEGEPARGADGDRSGGQRGHGAAQHQHPRGGRPRLPLRQPHPRDAGRARAHRLGPTNEARGGRPRPPQHLRLPGRHGLRQKVQGFLLHAVHADIQSEEVANLQLKNAMKRSPL
ncbi:Solute carrier family 23 member 2, partial [Blattella germanica]